MNARQFSRFVFAAAAAASMSAAAVEMRGFRGFAWGTDAGSLGEAREVSQEAGMRCYRRAHENLLYGDAPIREVRYCFRDDRLMLVVVDSQVDEATLVAEFQGSYGPPALRAPSRAVWGGATSRARVEIVGAPATMRIWANEGAAPETHARGDAAR